MSTAGCADTGARVGAGTWTGFAASATAAASAQEVLRQRRARFRLAGEAGRNYWHGSCPGIRQPTVGTTKVAATARLPCILCMGACVLTRRIGHQCPPGRSASFAALVQRVSLGGPS